MDLNSCTLYMWSSFLWFEERKNKFHPKRPHKNCSWTWYSFCQLITFDHALHKSLQFRQFVWTSKFDSSRFLGQLRYELILYLKRKIYNQAFERKFEKEQTSIMKSSRQVLVKEVLFWLGEHGQDQFFTWFKRLYFRAFK